MNGLSQVSRGCVPQFSDLRSESFANFRMTVSDADRNNPGKEVKVPFSFVVPQPLHLSLHRTRSACVIMFGTKLEK